jgi:DNA-binding NarL/FixJ family response regulator
MRLLIVDDSELIRQRLKELLQDIDGLEIIAEAADGYEGVEKFWRHRPDIVVLDIRMPKLNGVQVLQNIKTNDFPVIIIVLTNYSNPYFNEICLSEGADYCLDKSTEFEKVYQICNNLIARNRESERNEKSLDGII